MAMLQQAALESQAFMFRQSAQFEAEESKNVILAHQKSANQQVAGAKGMGAPPGLDAAAPKHMEPPIGADAPRPRPLGLASMVENASELKEPVHRTITPETT